MYVLNKTGTKYCLTALIIFITLLLLLTACSGKINAQFNLEPMKEDNGNFASMNIINPDSEIRGVWIASVFNIDYPSSNSLSPAQLRAELDSIISTCEKNRLNTIFFQVRPACDALYKSEIFPVSKYLSSDGTLPFDPLEYLVEQAHLKNIYVHAWVNPLRVTVSEAEISSLPENSPAREFPEWTVKYADGKLYLNAGLAEVRQLIADGVSEIVENYDVDGVVFDDYFYPYPVYDDNGSIAEFDDEEEYQFYGALFDNKADWRRENINQIIKLSYEAVHSADSSCVFGVAPSGVWQNNNGSNGGSNTRGFEAYNSLYCDALAWIKGGYIDFISPQIYWDFTSTITPYDVVLRWWNSALDGSDVKLYVSHASYKYEDGNWTSPKGQLTEQIEFARSERSYRGSIFYGYDEINRNINGASDDLISAYKNEIIYSDIASNGRGVEISSPQNGATMTEPSTYLIGISDPYYPLTLNGEKIGRTKSGCFSIMVSLKSGENKFVFSQNGVEYTHTLYYNISTGSSSNNESDSDSVTVLDSLKIIGTYPSKNVTTTGEELWVSCVAPYGSKVSAEINGNSYNLVMLTEPGKTSVDNGYIGAVYGKTIALPKAEKSGILDAGKIKFNADYYGETISADGCSVRVMGEDAKLAVRVLKDNTNLKFTETSSYYNDYTVQSAGMTDYITGQRNGFYKLRMGGYISETAVEETADFPADITKIESVTVDFSDDMSETEIKLKCDDKPAYYGKVEDGCFIVTFYNIDADNAPDAIIKPNPLTAECEVIRLTDSNRVRYSFKLFDERNFYGFDLRYEDGYTVVTLRNPKLIDLKSDAPLSGIKLVLDAGHGGTDNGAAGAAGLMEKDLNLMITLAAEAKLKELGAEVILTRADDSTVSLDERMELLAELKPDLCVSVHQNSMGYSSDITRIRGTLALYCMDSGLLLSDCVGKSVAAETGRMYRGANYQMLAMCRNPKFPTALIEVGFITCVEEYEQMLNGKGIEKTVSGIVNGILDFYACQADFLN